MPIFLQVLSAFHPTRTRASFVEDHEISNIIHELAGEWTIELPEPQLVLSMSKMKGWRETRFILNEDGTCEIRNLTLYMEEESIELQSLTRFLTRRPAGDNRKTGDIQRSEMRPELAGKVLLGTWESCPIGIAGYVDGIKLPIEGKKYAGISIYVDVGNHEGTELSTKDKWWWLGDFAVWRVKEKGKETYRLKVCESPVASAVERSGIIMKREE
jgi:hypothetical protein